MTSRNCFEDIYNVFMTSHNLPLTSIEKYLQISSNEFCLVVIPIQDIFKYDSPSRNTIRDISNYNSTSGNSIRDIFKWVLTSRNPNSRYLQMYLGYL